MKKFLIVCLAIALIGMSRLVNAQANVNPPAEPPPANGGQPVIMALIEGIEVPEEILVRIQSVFVGYAVTEATKGNQSGKEIYRLKIVHDQTSSEFPSMYLIYDLAWQFIEQQQYIPPPPPPETPPPAPEQPPPPQPEPPREQRRHEQRTEIEQPTDPLEEPRQRERDSDDD